jgi:hypothetical protein
MAQDEDHRLSNDDDEADFAAFVRRVTAQFENHPPTPHTRTPQDEKPSRLVAAEADLFRCEIAMRLTKLKCPAIAQCKNRRCRRQKRCGEQEKMLSLMEEVRAEVARQQAEWRPVPVNKKGASKRAPSVTRNRP